MDTDSQEKTIDEANTEKTIIKTLHKLKAKLSAVLMNNKLQKTFIYIIVPLFILAGIADLTRVFTFEDFNVIESKFQYIIDASHQGLFLIVISLTLISIIAIILAARKNKAGYYLYVILSAISGCILSANLKLFVCNTSIANFFHSLSPLGFTGIIFFIVVSLLFKKYYFTRKIF